MKSKTRILKAIYIITLAIGALSLVLFLRSGNKSNESIIEGVEIAAILTESGSKIPVTIANTTYLRNLGLSGTQSLMPGTGKLFIFDDSDYRSFWMKDMNYPIDIIWIDENLNIVDIEENILPETYPNTFQSPYPVKYVLEINALQANNEGLSVDSKIVILKNP